MITRNSLRRDPEEHLDYDLALGERWEQTVADQITALGLPASRLEQTFYDVGFNGPVNRRRREKGLAPKPHPCLAALLRPYQVDLRVKLGPVRMVLIEVKALTSVAFDFPQIHIGRTEKLDRKVLRVAAIALINRSTRETWVVPNDDTLLHRKRSLVDPKVIDYTVFRKDLTPLEAWVDYLRDSHMQQSA